jgi:hypothetical protein
MIHFVDYIDAIAVLAIAVEETLSSVGTIVLVVEETLSFGTVLVGDTSGSS